MAKKRRIALPILAAFLLMGLIYTMLVSGAAIKANGSIESTAGGFVFPDGSVQETAAFPDCTPITYVPVTLTEEGVYCFTDNLETSITTGNAITIEADNVLIDLKGWKLDGLAAGSGTSATGIYAFDLNNVTIRNGTISGFKYGITISRALGSQGHLVEEIRADQNTFRGIFVAGTGNTVRNNRVIDTGGSTSSTYAYGIVVEGSGNRVLNNDIDRVVAQGAGNAYAVHGEFAGDSVVEGNRISRVQGFTGFFSVFTSKILTVCWLPETASPQPHTASPIIPRPASTWTILQAMSLTLLTAALP